MVTLITIFDFPKDFEQIVVLIFSDEMKTFLINNFCLSRKSTEAQQFRVFLAKWLSNAAGKRNGLVRELNPGPLAPEARIIPLDQQATVPHKAIVESLFSVII